MDIVLKPVLLCLIMVISPPFPLLSVTVKGLFLFILYPILLSLSNTIVHTFSLKNKTPERILRGSQQKSKDTFNDKNERKMSMNYMSNTKTISNKKALELRYETHSPINRPSAFSNSKTEYLSLPTVGKVIPLPVAIILYTKLFIFPNKTTGSFSFSYTTM